MFYRAVTGISAVIASGTALSNAIYLGNYVLCGIVMPAAWTAASLTFQVSHDGVTYQDLFYGAGEYTIAAGGGAAAGLSVALPVDAFRPWRYIKVRSGVIATPVNQAAARSIVLLARGI